MEMRSCSQLRSTCFLDHRGRILTDALLWMQDHQTELRAVCKKEKKKKKKEKIGGKLLVHAIERFPGEPLPPLQQ